MKRPPIWDPQTAIGDGINPRPNPAEQGLLAQVILSADGRLRSLAMYPTAYNSNYVIENIKILPHTI